MLLNSKWMLDRATRLSERIKAEAKGPEKQIEILYLHALGREPNEIERTMARNFLAAEGSLSDLCHTLMNSNEFLFWE